MTFSTVSKPGSGPGASGVASDSGVFSTTIGAPAAIRTRDLRLRRLTLTVDNAAVFGIVEDNAVARGHALVVSAAKSARIGHPDREQTGIGAGGAR